MPGRLFADVKPTLKVLQPIMRKMKNAWTDDQNDRLKPMVSAGASVTRAAAAFNRPIISVRNQAHKLGAPFPARAASRADPETRILAAKAFDRSGRFEKKCNVSGPI
jgi:hypothetical protein